MSDQPIDVMTAQVAVIDRATSASTLEEIARLYPHLWAEVAAHPNATPRLLDWLAVNGGFDVQRAVAKRRSVVETPTVTDTPTVVDADTAVTPGPSYEQPSQVWAEATDQPAEPSAPVQSNRRPALIALFAGVGLVVLALVIWLVVRAVGGAPSPTPSGLPDFTSQPTWAPSVQVSPPPGATDATVSDSGVDGVAIINWVTQDSSNPVQAVNLNTSKLLWTMITNGYLDSDGTGTVFVGDLQNGTMKVVDVLTGQVVTSLNMPLFDVLYYDDTMVITQAAESGNICASLKTSPDVCVWSASSWLAAGPVAFGGGQWINTPQGVVDIATGSSAPFGSDAGSHCADSSCDPDQDVTVLYAGPQPDSIVRLTVIYSDLQVDHDIWTLQGWDATTGTSKGAAIDLHAVPAIDDWDASAFYAINFDQPGQNVLTAYSWQTGQQLWQATPTGATIDYVVSLGKTVYGGDVLVVYGSQGTESETSTVFDATNGQQLWTGSDFFSVGAGQHVAYLLKAGILYAFDTNSSSFAQLWSLPLPADDARIYALGTSIVAISSSTGQIWTLA